MNEYILVRADKIRNGMLVDLEGDKFADPDRNHIEFESELQTVCYHKRETPTCIAIGFEGFDVVGFPLDHFLRVREGKRSYI